MGNALHTQTARNTRDGFFSFQLHPASIHHSALSRGASRVQSSIASQLSFPTSSSRSCFDRVIERRPRPRLPYLRIQLEPITAWQTTVSLGRFPSVPRPKFSPSPNSISHLALARFNPSSLSLSFPPLSPSIPIHLPPRPPVLHHHPLCCPGLTSNHHRRPRPSQKCPGDEATNVGKALQSCDGKSKRLG